jgi:hypothetical protein
MKTFVRVVRLKDFEQEAVLGKRAVSPLFMPKDGEFHKRMEVLEAGPAFHLGVFLATRRFGMNTIYKGGS